MFIFFILITYGRIGIYERKLHFLIIIFLALIISLKFTGGFGSLWFSIENVIAIYYLIRYQ